MEKELLEEALRQAGLDAYYSTNISVAEKIMQTDSWKILVRFIYNNGFDDGFKQGYED